MATYEDRPSALQVLGTGFTENVKSVGIGIAERALCGVSVGVGILETAREFGSFYLVPSLLHMASRYRNGDFKSHTDVEKDEGLLISSILRVIVGVIGVVTASVIVENNKEIGFNLLNPDFWKIMAIPTLYLGYVLGDVALCRVFIRGMKELENKNKK